MTATVERKELMYTCVLVFSSDKREKTARQPRVSQVSSFQGSSKPDSLVKQNLRLYSVLELCWDGEMGDRIESVLEQKREKNPWKREKYFLCKEKNIHK